MAFLLLCTAHLAAQTGSWSGKLEVQGTKLTIVFHLDDEDPCMDSPDQGAFGIPVEVERSLTGKILIRIPAIAASFDGLWLPGKLLGTYRQGPLALPLALTPGVEKAERPQTPSGPFPYACEELSFANGEAVLHGTLVLPEDCSRRTPVLIMVSGSGQQDRDESIFEHKPFAVIADALARAGIATLRYDDRGVGASTGDVAFATTEDFKEDALAGIRLLRERFDRVGVIGHSEGGTIALMLAAEQQVDFIVSLAGMVVSGLETVVAQSRTALVDAGYPEDILECYGEAVREAAYVRVHGGRTPAPDELNLPDELKRSYELLIRQFQIPWMTKFLSLDTRPLLGGIRCPVLALNGTKDIQVAYDSNLEALRSGLPAHPAHRIEAVEGLNHLFQHCRTGAVTEYREITETFAPEVLETIVQWLQAL